MINIEKMPLKRDLLRSVPTLLKNDPPVAIILFDIDNFKALNDTLGHEKGDIRLTEILSSIEPIVRAKGTIYRWGTGDEFCVVLPNCSADEAGGTGERMRRAIDGLAPLEKIKNTLSVGVACSEDVGGDVSSLLDAADTSMYRAKRLGGNQVAVFYGETSRFIDRSLRKRRSDLSDLFSGKSEMKIVYSELTLAQSVKDAIDIYFKDDEERKAWKEHFLVPTDEQYIPNLRFRGTHVACVCEVRSSGYLASSLAEAGLTTRIVSATEPAVRAQLHQQSFIALGAKSNQMTDQLLRDENNILATIDTSELADLRFRSNAGKYLMPHRNKAVEDYGLIISIHPKRFPDETWIACAGLGEHGTSGAAHFLAFSWWQIAEKIAKLGGRADKAMFACVVKTSTSADSDGEAKLFNFALSEEHWLEYPRS